MPKSASKNPVHSRLWRIPTAAVALRAYYLCEKRRKLGIPGDALSDWREAERQLKGEAVWSLD